MARLTLTLACGDYDRTRALVDGTSKPEGIELNYIPLSPREIFVRMIRYREFDVSEMSLSSYLMLRSRGQAGFMAIPVFPSRFFRHSAIYVRTAAGIKEPRDLMGKRVGVPEYVMTAAVWARGILQHEYGVVLEKIHWFTEGQGEPGRKEKLELHLPPEIRLEVIPEDKTLNDMLERGELDGHISAQPPSVFLKGAGVKRLFSDSKAVEMEYCRKTGIFPIMHTVVIRDDVYERHPWAAMSLYKAFCQAKELCYQSLISLGTLPYSLAWLQAQLEEERALLGPDPFPYGLEPNRKTLETIIQYEYEQGLIAKKMSIESLFAPSTVEGYRV